MNERGGGGPWVITQDYMPEICQKSRFQVLPSPKERVSMGDVTALSLTTGILPLCVRVSNHHVADLRHLQVLKKKRKEEG